MKRLIKPHSERGATFVETILLIFGLLVICSAATSALQYESAVVAVKLEMALEGGGTLSTTRGGILRNCRPIYFAFMVYYPCATAEESSTSDSSTMGSTAPNGGNRAAFP